MKRIIIVAAISGIVSSVITLILFWFVFASSWVYFIIPAIMGTCIHKFGKIPAEEVAKDDKLEKKIGFLCAGFVLFFILLTTIPIIILSFKLGMAWTILLNIPFYLICALAVWYGYNRGVAAAVDSYYDDNSDNN